MRTRRVNSFRVRDLIWENFLVAKITARIKTPTPTFFNAVKYNGGVTILTAYLFRNIEKPDITAVIKAK